MPLSPRRPNGHVAEVADPIGAADAVVLLEDENTRDGSFVAALRRLGAGARHPQRGEVAMELVAGMAAILAGVR